MRCFIAIDYPDEVLKKVVEIIHQLSSSLPPRSVRWVSESNLHLTLKFLGEIELQQVSQIKDILTDIASAANPFSFNVLGSGIFPSPARPSILWIGNSSSDQMAVLAKEIDRAVTPVGILMESHPFSPHLTIGRVNKQQDAAILRRLSSDFQKKHIGELGLVQVDRIKLYQSELRPGGPIYTAIGQYRLGGKE